jgi:hypothetical protein
MKWLPVIILFASCTWAQVPDVGDIMSRVGINQARSLEERQNWVYTQKQLLRMVRGNGRIAREEHRQYVVTPKFRGVGKKLVSFDGRYENKGKFHGYDKPGYEYKGTDIDGQILDSISNDMTDDHGSRDGIGSDLFPLTYHQQLKYRFKFLGTGDFHGRRVYRIAFEPKPHQTFGDSLWKGEALIGAAEYQPVLVQTKMARCLPLVVKTLLGTTLKGLGFSVSYQKFAKGVWFPVSYGGEFYIRAVFFYRRTISVSMVNSDFRHTEVDSNVAYATEEK